MTKDELLQIIGSGQYILKDLLNMLKVSDFKEDIGIYLAVVLHYEDVDIQYLPMSLRDDKKSMKILLDEGHSLKLLGNKLLNDKEFVQNILLDGYVVDLADVTLIKDLINDKDFALKLMKNSDRLQILGNDLKDDDDVVRAAIEYDGWQLRYASNRLKNNREMLKEAILTSPFVISFVPQMITIENMDIVELAIEKKADILKYLKREQLKDTVLIFKILEKIEKITGLDKYWEMKINKNVSQCNLVQSLSVNEDVAIVLEKLYPGEKFSDISEDRFLLSNIYKELLAKEMTHIMSNNFEKKKSLKF
jgi:hypothetical protein